MISPLAEDIASFAKKLDSIEDLKSGDSNWVETKTKTTDSIKVSQNLKLESFITKVHDYLQEGDEPIQCSLLLSFS